MQIVRLNDGIAPSSETRCNNGVIHKQNGMLIILSCRVANTRCKIVRIFVEQNCTTLTVGIFQFKKSYQILQFICPPH